jgi:hypothetical protein
MKIKSFISTFAISAAVLFSTSGAQAFDVMPTSLEDLQSLNNTELNELYDYGTAYVIPSADQPGTELSLTGLPLPVPGYEGPSSFLNFFWDGKVFTTDVVGATTLNNILFPNTPITFNDVSAQVVLSDESLTNDGQPVITLNYDESNVLAARLIRDEMRLIAPNLYLGRAYLKNGPLVSFLTGKEFKFAIWFALEDKN